ncbi:exodeoxyribonuclease [Octopus bimaculoides]|nr:exodeoxyribonuclease [Octopus bimaculoides]|eukprot:XP_014780504.1 PREDICTED: exodeoxyribonuclease-like [Octopus bimaculoides]
MLKVTLSPDRQSADNAKAEVKKQKTDAEKQEGSSDKDGQTHNLKVISWNINGIRAFLGKNGFDYFKREDPDIFCLQETKCPESQVPEDCKIKGYYNYWYSAETDGYAGCCLYSKKKPISVTKGIGIEKHDKEGRVITAEFEKFYVVTTYIPNAGKKLVRLDYRIKEWDVDFLDYLVKLDGKKPVILCGDLNVSHLEIDLKNPKNNKKTAGFTQEERDGFSKMLDKGFVDSFRHLYPKKTDVFTFWTYMMNARAKNVGWRLDYFVISKRLVDNLTDTLIHKDEMGSDHCPIVLLMNM